MVLRTYFWSIPFSKQGKVRFSVALTNEMLGPILSLSWGQTFIEIHK